MQLTQITSDVISTNTISQLISDGFTSMNVATIGTQTINSGAANTLIIKTNNANAVTIAPSGNVGIGTTNPTANLHISSTGSVQILLEADTDNVDENHNPSIRFTQDAGTVTSRVGYTSGGNSFEVMNAFSGELLLGTNNLERLRIDTIGNIGLGNSSPTANLSFSNFAGTAGTSNKITLYGTASSGYGFGISSNQLNYISNGSHVFYDSTGERLRLTSTTFTANTSSITIPAIDIQTRSVEIGAGRTGNGYAYVDLIGDATYSDYGLRIIRGNTGANTISSLIHRGIGDLQIQTQDAAAIILATNLTERMRITAAGNVGIGTASPVTRTHILQTNVGGDVGLFVSQGSNGYTSIASTATLYLGSTYNATGQSCKIVASHSDGTTGDHGQNMQFWTVNSGSTPTERMRITASGVVELTAGQLKFPATQNASSDANTLDDYEEGTFTPAFTSNGGTNPTMTYTLQSGSYTKIGNMVYFSIRLVTTGRTGGTGILQVSGLPFTASSAVSTIFACAQGFIYLWTTSPAASFVNSGGNTLALYSSTVNNTQSQVTDLPTGGCYYNVSGCYIAT